MRVLFVSAELIGSAVVHRLLREGHEVKLYIGHEDRKNCFDGFVEKTKDWKNELDWVGKDGLIVFDDVVFDGAQEALRAEGYSVFGGDSKSDRLELDRQFFQEMLREYGLPILPSHDFKTADGAIDFIKKNPGMWVLKQNSHIGMLNYVGQREDGEDVLDMLQIYKERDISPIQLQQRVFGVEVGIGRQFNGTDWVGPVKINFEHKPLCNGGIGPLTAEMGTLAWCESDEHAPLFEKTLSKIRGYLQKIHYKGDVDINCIANEDGVWPLEATMRFGTPTTQLYSELYQSPWGDLLKAIADGKPYAPVYSTGYGIVISIAVPPFPYAPETFGESEIEVCTGTSIFFTEELTEEERRQIHFEEVSLEIGADSKKRYYLSGKHGYALYVTGHGDTVEEAQKKAYNVIKKIILPKMFYRTDIGDKFIREDHVKLKEWGLVA